MERFPIGGPREPVYNFFKDHGYVMSKSSDKHWIRADGVQAYLYGTGSMAMIYDKDRNLLADAPLAEAVAKADFRR